jgi:hypothetical protein
VYSVSVICDPSKDYPFTVNVENCYAPVETKPDGTKNIKMTEAIDRQKSSFAMWNIAGNWEMGECLANHR